MPVASKLEFPISPKWPPVFRSLLYKQIQIGDERCQSLQSWNFLSHFQSLCHNFLLDKNEMEMSLSFICLGDDNPLSLYSHHVLCTKSQHTICTHNLQFLCCKLLLKKMRWRWVSPLLWVSLLFVLVMMIIQSPWVVHKILTQHLHTQPATLVSQFITHHLHTQSAILVLQTLT